MLKDIRIGQHADKIRLVFTFEGSKIPLYQLAEKGEELKVFIGPGAREEARKEKAAPAAPSRQTVMEVKPQAERVEAAPPSPAEKPSAIEKEAPARVAEPGKPARLPAKGLMSLNLTNADVHDVFRLVADVSAMNIIAGEDVKGKITIRLVNVPWDQALDVILSTKNLLKTEEGNIIRIATMETVRKEIDEKQKEQESRVKAIENKEKVEEMVTETINLNYAKAIDMQRMIMGIMLGGGAGAPAMGAAGPARGLLSPRGSVRADERTNTIILQDTRSRVEEIRALVKKLDTPTPQVLIEARVVQAQTAFARTIGVQWGGSYNQTAGSNWGYGLTGNNPNAAAGWGFTPSQTGAGTNLIMPSNFIVNFPANTSNTPAGGMGVSFGKLTGSLVNLDLRLQLGETNSQTKVIARPKLATLTNREAIIKQGEKIPYETTSAAGTQVQFIDAVLSLKVTPTVTPDGAIMMKVIVTRDNRGTFRSPVNQVPSIDSREASTEVLVKDGETLVIGGIYESDTQIIEQGIPWLMKIPVIGWLFKNRETVMSKNELLIFITPTILTPAGKTNT